jgi:hypothetical protein
VDVTVVAEVKIESDDDELEVRKEGQNVFQKSVPRGSGEGAVEADDDDLFDTVVFEVSHALTDRRKISQIAVWTSQACRIGVECENRGNTVGKGCGIGNNPGDEFLVSLVNAVKDAKSETYRSRRGKSRRRLIRRTPVRGGYRH